MMQKNTIIILLMVSLVLFSMITIGSAEEQLGEFFAQYGEVK